MRVSRSAVASSRASTHNQTAPASPTGSILAAGATSAVINGGATAYRQPRADAPRALRASDDAPAQIVNGTRGGQKLGRE